MTGAAAGDFAPLGRRLGLLQVVRLAFVGIVLVAGAAAPAAMGDHAAVLVSVSAVYALVSVGTELARRGLGHQGLPLVGGMVLFDGIYLGLVTAVSGGPRSVLGFLLFVHVIAVTLLVSFRTGLKAAVWYSLLVATTFYGQQAGLDLVAPVPNTAHAAVFTSIGLLLVAAATAWFSSLNEGELRRGKAELRALAEMSADMAATRQREGVVGALLWRVVGALGARRAAVVLAGDAGFQALVPSSGAGVVTAGEGTEPGDVVARCCNQRVPVLVRELDTAGDSLLAAALPGAINVVAVPLLADGECLGALALEHGGGRRACLSTRALAVLGQFAAHAALALRNAALQAEVERLARTDPLTGLANRRVFQEALARELALAARRREPCALVVLDVDHFKAVNDTHGHQAGDEVLRQLGMALAEVSRGTDLAARYGGEEFAVILPSCSPAEAVAVAERLRSALAARPCPVPVTASAGVAAYPVDAADGDGLVAAADEALYASKRAGRDRVTSSQRRAGSLPVPERARMRVPA